MSRQIIHELILHPATENLCQFIQENNDRYDGVEDRLMIYFQTHELFTENIS